MPSSNFKFIIFNFIGLQVTWAGCAYGAINDIPILGIIIGLIYLCVHFFITSSRTQDFIVLIIISILGITLDIINYKFGILGFKESQQGQFYLPNWLIVLWLVFILNIPHSLFWLGKNYILAFFAGAMGGSFSYWLGDKIGAINLSEPIIQSVLIYAVEWGIFFIISLHFVKTINKYFKRSRTRVVT